MSESTSPASGGPLEGFRVLELGQLIAAPFAARILAEYGARVVKVEPPGTGDPLRKWRRLHDGTSLWWRVQARNKLSVTADLKTPEGQEIARRLAAEADILIENFRPGTLEKWGLGFEALSALNPKLVMVRLSGYGQTGPYREQPGFGVIGEAMGGMRYTTGSPDRAPARTGVSIGDSLAALYAVIGALMGVIPRGQERRPRPGRRRRAPRERLQRHGRAGAGIRRLWRDPRAIGRRPARNRADRFLSVPRRLCPDRRKTAIPSSAV